MGNLHTSVCLLLCVYLHCILDVVTWWVYCKHSHKKRLQCLTNFNWGCWKKKRSGPITTAATIESELWWARVDSLLILEAGYIVLARHLRGPRRLEEKHEPDKLRSASGTALDARSRPTFPVQKGSAFLISCLFPASFGHLPVCWSRLPPLDTRLTFCVTHLFSLVCVCVGLSVCQTGWERERDSMRFHCWTTGKFILSAYSTNLSKQPIAVISNMHEILFFCCLCNKC